MIFFFLSWSLCLHVCRLWHTVGSVSKTGTFCLGKLMDILKSNSKHLQKVLSKPNVLNAMFSTLTYHVTDPHQVLALLNQTISSSFYSVSLLEAYIYWGRKPCSLHISSGWLHSPIPISVALLRPFAKRFENCCQQLTSEQVTICRVPKIFHNQLPPPQLPPTGFLFYMIIYHRTKVLKGRNSLFMAGAVHAWHSQTP